MSWHYRSPGAFPAAFHDAMRTITSSLGDPYPLAVGTAHELAAKAEEFRWFKWCIRQRNEYPDLSLMLDTYNIRTRQAGSMLLITANPTKIAEFIRLNPELAASILPDCQ